MTNTSFQPAVKAPFNMAIASLERISDILREITRNSIERDMTSEERQKRKIELVKGLGFNSFPLLKESFETDTFEKIKELSPATKKRLIKDGTEYSKTNGSTIIYSKELENQLDSLIVKISRELQKEKYLMPPKEDHGKSITGM